MLVKTGNLVDASITESPRKPGGIPNFEVEEKLEGEPKEGENGGSRLKMVPRQGQDTEAK